VQPVSPLVSVIMAAHDAERFLAPAVASVLRQTVSDLELVVVDDGSQDGTPDVLAEFDDPRLEVVRNDERLGLAASLNLALERARSRYVARLDADDVALPRRLELQLSRLRAAPSVAIVGSAVLDLDDESRLHSVHPMPVDSAAVRWATLFSSPFYHPTVLLDRDVLDREGLRYDPAFLESEDYELWARVLSVAEGENLPEPLVLYRVHAGQATRARRGLQRGFQRRVALGEIARLAPSLPAERAELAWLLGAGEDLAPGELENAADALLELVSLFGKRYPAGARAAREKAARMLARAAPHAERLSRVEILRHALRLDPLLPLNAAARRAGRAAIARRTKPEAEAWLCALGRRDGQPRPVRVAYVSPEPTPYRAQALERLAEDPELELTVIHAAENVQWRSWRVEPRYQVVVLDGFRLPGAARLFFHEYPVSRGVFDALRRASPDVVVACGWSTFPSQAAVLWCRAKRVPYVLQVESHDWGPRRGWRRAVKGAVVPRLVRGASGVLVTGTLVRRSMLDRGADPDRIGLFAVTVDVEEYAARAGRLAGERAALRRELGAGPDDVVVLSVARLAPEKGLETLLRAAAATADARLVITVVGEGPERRRLEELARSLGLRLTLTGARPWEHVVEAYVAADVFALLSEREPWGLVVNEAAACRLPLVLSDHVGAAYDLLRDGENGVLVPAGDVRAAGDALRLLAGDRELRHAFGARSRELVRGWGLEPSIAGFRDAVRMAAGTGASVRASR